jgi:prepilin-type processing-associated H-X9-DG protein
VYNGQKINLFLKRKIKVRERVSNSDNEIIESLQQERDGFVALAFVAVHILLELDDQGNILFVDGAVYGLLGKQSSEIKG